MRVADYIFKQLADWGARHVFLVTGGGAMHLNDALGRESRLRYVCCLHEQACAMAAEGYARIAGAPGIVSVTTGPGGTNAVTGVMGAWVDSIPMLVISGQVKQETMITVCPELKLRQLGDQEINIVDVVRPITKYAATVRTVSDVRRQLEKAWHLCRNGRPGPVWLDIPLDIQAAEIGDACALDCFEPEEPCVTLEADTLSQILTLLQQARRPVIVAGNGVTLAGARQEFRDMVGRLNIPVLTAISGIDLMGTDDPLFFGRPGILGARAGNFILQNSDLVLVIGARMSIRVIGYAFDKVARHATRVMVDIDAGELRKPTFRVDVPVLADAGEFIRAVNRAVPVPMEEKVEWLTYCRRVRAEYPVVLPEHRNRTDYVSSYRFPEMVGALCRGDEIVVTGNGTAYTSTFQAFPLKPGMRMFANVACASMGYGLPAAIGAALAGNRDVLCFTGDGSIQMNIQELQTLVNERLPVKLFVYNNAGYLSIKLTQTAFFQKHYVGSESGSGVVLPDMVKLAEVYGIPAFRLHNHREAEQLLPEIMAMPGPVFCEVMTDPYEELGPKAASYRCADGRMVSKPLEDLAPFLSRDEFRRNMIVPVMPEEELE